MKKSKELHQQEKKIIEENNELFQNIERKLDNEISKREKLEKDYIKQQQKLSFNIQQDCDLTILVQDEMKFQQNNLTSSELI